MKYVIFGGMSTGVMLYGISLLYGLTGTLELVGGRPDRAVMVGDSAVDFATAVAAKVPAIGVTFGYTPRPVRELAPEMGVAEVIDHFGEFMPALDRCLRERGYRTPRSK